MEFHRLAVVALVLGSAPGAFAQANIPLTVSGHEATGVVQLPGGVGAELSITFEQVVGLNPAALEVSASLVNPLDAAFRARLGGGGLIVPPAAFPVVIRIEPSPSSALSFSGTVALSLHTHNLSLVPDVPLALHSASGGGSFRDITRSEGIGSYRAGGTGGGFSEFVIVVDRRPIDTVIAAKFDAAQDLLDDHATSVPGAVAADLQARLGQARTTYQAGATVAAIGEVTAFADVVRAHSGDIPDVWRAHDGRVNVAGLLRAAADTLKFSLTRKGSAR
jgi:uncharacterized protein DUF6689